MPWPDSAIAIAPPIGESPARMAAGRRIAAMSASVGVGQKNRENTYVTTNRTT